MKIHRSSEDYLAAILVLENKKGSVRNVDVAEYMGYSKPSITNAVSVLRKAGYVRIDESRNIKLTTVGKKVAEKIYEKYEFFLKYLMAIGVDEKTALEDACKLEHAISDESFQKLKISLYPNIQKC